MVRIISQLVEFIQYSGVNIYGQNNQSVVSKMVEFGEMTFLVNVWQYLIMTALQIGEPFRTPLLAEK